MVDVVKIKKKKNETDKAYKRVAGITEKSFYPRKIQQVKTLQFSLQRKRYQS